MNNMEKLAEVLNRFPGVEVTKIEDAPNDGTIYFKCSNELSFAKILVGIQEISPNDGISYWMCFPYSDIDHCTVYYGLCGPDDLETRHREARNLARKYTDNFEKFYEAYRRKMHDEGGVLPDLSFVTVAQMLDELSSRGINYAMVWKDLGTNYTKLGTGGSPTKVMPLIKEAWKIAKQRIKEDNCDPW
jgi:hypothetical protein